ncbi:MAG: cobalt-precorrin-6A reductase [Rhodospirillales bacterium]|nr:cobalt-precorrin-6A reductase [Alphaproteobacteria bacterium]MBL6948333.1 cobalt-precorrin-6A reductase [Rhodospirillales bacterium]
MPDNGQDKKHLLILGGTGEARELARRVQLMIGKRVRVTTSLAGRRDAPPELAGEVRTGGFGGVQGMMTYIAENAVDLVVDATHPFSPTISDHAAIACGNAMDGGTPRLQLVRPPWRFPPSAQWLEVGDFPAAAEILKGFARRVFLTTGMRGLEAFSGLDDMWFLVRLLDEPDTPPPLKNHQVITGRPPYGLEDERAILADHTIDTMVAKNAGGGATEAKIFAAGEAGVKIVLIRRPPPEPGPTAETVDEAFAWVEAQI